MKSALIGTDRTSDGVIEDPVIQQFLTDNSVSTEEKYLEAATYMYHLKTAGYKPAKFEGKPKAFDGNKTGEDIGLAASGDLKEILYGPFESALPEFLLILKTSGKRLPDEMLPDILDICRSKPAIQNLLNAVLDEKASWLISKNPDWNYFSIQPMLEYWQTGNKKQRIDLIRSLRETDPPHAITLIRSTWEVDSLQDKQDFLKLLIVGLSMGDEPFLEFCLDFRRKEIRKLAARLLAMLPGSELSSRVFNRLKKLLVLKRAAGTKPKLSVSLPEKCTPEMIRDGIDPAAQWFKGGVKVSRLGQMISITPPARWEEAFEMDSADCLRVFVRSEWSEMLVQALIESSALHENEAWMIALLDFGFTNKEKSRFQNLNFNPIFPQLSQKAFQKVSDKWIASEKDLLPEGHLACQILKKTELNWSNKLTLSVTAALSRWMGFETSRYWNGWHYRSLLKKAAYQSNPRIVDKIEFIWPRNSRIWQSWEKEVTEFLDVLKFRKKFNHNIQN